GRHVPRYAEGRHRGRGGAGIRAAAAQARGVRTRRRVGHLRRPHPERIRQLARKVASKRTRIITGWTTGKSYHGDLMERSMCLVIALTGNWGKKGSGIRGIGAGMFDGPYLQSMKPRAGQQVTEEMFRAEEQRIQAALAEDPTLTREILL